MNEPRDDISGRPCRLSAVRVRAGRRGFAVATVVILLLMMNILAFGAIRGGGDESSIASLRVETLRALYACDAGLIVAIGELGRGTDASALPASLSLPGASVAMEAGAASEGIEVVIEGRSGFGRRRVLVEVEGSD